jgi:hypothetical protein
MWNWISKVSILLLFFTSEYQGGYSAENGKEVRKEADGLCTLNSSFGELEPHVEVWWEAMAKLRGLRGILVGWGSDTEILGGEDCAVCYSNRRHECNGGRRVWYSAVPERAEQVTQTGTPEKGLRSGRQWSKQSGQENGSDMLTRIFLLSS